MDSGGIPSLLPKPPRGGLRGHLWLSVVMSLFRQILLGSSRRRLGGWGGRKKRMILRRRRIFQILEIAICRDWCTNFGLCHFSL